MGGKEGSREMLNRGPSSRPGPSGKGVKAGRRRKEPEGLRLLVPLGLPSPAKPLLQKKLKTRIPSRSSSVGCTRRSLSPLAAGRRPAPPTTSLVESRRGGVRVPTPPTPPPRRGFACAVPRRAATLSFLVRVGAYQEDIHCRGKGEEVTPRELNKRERGQEANPEDVVKLYTLHPER